MTSLRTPEEQAADAAMARIFEASPDSTEERLASFAKYVRRQDLKRFLALYEVFKLALPVKGSVIDCGVFRGQSLMSWAQFSAILEPENLTRRIFGFDSFEGLTGVTDRDAGAESGAVSGELRADSRTELSQLIEQYDSNRLLGHIDKVHTIAGDALKTIPEFIEANAQLVVSLLFLDFDLFEPTRVAIEHFVPRMPKGAVIAFDELDNPRWPGETLALLETVGIRNLRLQRLEWDPYIAYAVLD